MNVFKYIWLKVKNYFNSPIEADFVTFVDLYNFPPYLSPKEKDPERWKVNTQYSVPKVEEKPKRPYNRVTKQQVARIKVLVGRGKTAKQIAKEVGLPYDNVNYYVKKFGG